MATKAKAAPAATTGNLAATTGLDYQAADGTFGRLEAGDVIQADLVAPQAVEWMTAAGFLVPVEG